MKKINFDFDAFANKLSSVGKVIGFLTIIVSVTYRLNKTFGLFEYFKKKYDEKKKELIDAEQAKNESVNSIKGKVEK